MRTQFRRSPIAPKPYTIFALIRSSEFLGKTRPSKGQRKWKCLSVIRYPESSRRMSAFRRDRWMAANPIRDALEICKIKTHKAGMYTKCYKISVLTFGCGPATNDRPDRKLSHGTMSFLLLGISGPGSGPWGRSHNPNALPVGMLGAFSNVKSSSKWNNSSSKFSVFPPDMKRQ
jgi:hypothetical protein